MGFILHNEKKTHCLSKKRGNFVSLARVLTIVQLVIAERLIVKAIFFNETIRVMFI